MPKVTRPPDFDDACAHCGCVNCLDYNRDTNQWTCRNCASVFAADPRDPRLRDPEDK